MLTKSGIDVTQAVMIGTKRTIMRTVKAAAVESGAAAIADWTGFNKKDTEPAAGMISLYDLFGNSHTKLVLGFYSTSGVGFVHAPADGDTGGFEVLGYMYGSSAFGGPPFLIASTAITGCVVGSLTYDTCVDDGDTLTTALWFDSITLNFSDWFGGVAVYDHAANRVAWLVIGDTAGLEYLYVRSFGLSTAAGEAPSLGVVGFTY